MADPANRERRSPPPPHTPAAIALADAEAAPRWFLLAALGVTAYLLGTIFHEAIGHGLTALAVGLHPTRVSAVDLEVSFARAPLWKVRLVAAAGCGGNLLLAGLAAIGYGRTRHGAAATHFFFWLLTTTGILVPGGYLMALSLPGIGDWGDFVHSFAHPLAWKLLLTAIGIAISVYGLRWGARHLAEFLPVERHRGRAWRLVLIPYFAGSGVATLAGAFNPTSPMLILISSMAASFAGTSWLIWIGAIAARRPGLAPPGAAALRWEISHGWLAAGAVAAAAFVAVLGPGLPR